MTTLSPLEWYNLVPDTTHAFVTSGYGKQYPFTENCHSGHVGKITLMAPPDIQRQDFPVCYLTL